MFIDSLLLSCVIIRLVLSNSSAVTKSGRVIGWKAIYYSWGGRSQRKRALMRNVKSGLPITFNTPTQEAGVHVGSPIGISGKFYLDWSSEHFTNTFTITCWICSGQFPGSWSAFCCLQYMALNSITAGLARFILVGMLEQTTQFQLLSTTIVFVQVLSPSQKCQLYLTVSVQLPAMLH